jgi:hypothetical protein
MKKLLFSALAVALIMSASSCKKCGYCQFPTYNDEAVCSGGSDPLTNTIDGNDYKQVKANCQAQGGNWVDTK